MYFGSEKVNIYVYLCNITQDKDDKEWLRNKTNAKIGKVRHFCVARSVVEILNSDFSTNWSMARQGVLYKGFYDNQC